MLHAVQWWAGEDGHERMRGTCKNKKIEGMEEEVFRGRRGSHKQGR